MATLALGCGDDDTRTADGGVDGGSDSSLPPGCEIPAPEGAPRFDALSQVPRFVVVGTDFASSYIGWLNEDGFAINGNWINSGTTRPGLVATLSGDVATPTQLPGDGSFYILDRFGTNVITRVTIPQGVVLDQLR